MKITVVNGAVTIECSVLEGKLLMQGANLMHNEIEGNMTNAELEQFAKEFGATSGEVAYASEELVTTLPHEDNEMWQEGGVSGGND